MTYVARTPSTIELLQYAPQLATAAQVTVAQAPTERAATRRRPSRTLPAPLRSGWTTPIDLTQPVPLAPASIFHAGEPVFIRVSDADQNLDNTVADTVLVTVRDDLTQ